MNRSVPILIAALVVVAALVGGVGSAVAAGADGVGPDVPTEAATENATTTNVTANETNASDTAVSAGAQLAGIIGAQQAEHTSAVETKAFDVALERSPSNETKATVVANRVERLRDRLQSLENASGRLETRYENGSISRDAYVGQMTALNARTESLQRQVNHTRTRSTSLPPQALTARGVNQSDLDELTNRSGDVVSPHAASVAKTVAGSNVGHPVGPPTDVPANGHAGKTDDGDREPPGASGSNSKTPDRSNGSDGQSENETATHGQNHSAVPSQVSTKETHKPGVTNQTDPSDHNPDGAISNGSNASPPGRNGSTPPGLTRNETLTTLTESDRGNAPRSILDAVLGYLR